MRTPAILLLACLGASGLAAETGLLATDACRRAVDVLDREEARAAALPRAPAGSAPGDALRALPVTIPPALARARHTAASACLGPGAPPSRAPQRRVEPPTSVAGTGPPPPPRTPAPALPANVPALPLAPAPAPRLPQVLSSCDAAGCWSSDGTRLQRLGPVLNGPSGACSVVGNAVTCP